MDSIVRNNRSLSRYELQIDEEAFASAYYRIEDGNVVLIHTEVPFQFSGEGYAKALADGVFQMVKANGGKVVVKCGFMGRYVARHPELLDMVVG